MNDASASPELDEVSEEEASKQGMLPSLGDQLRKRRQAAGLSLRQFARMIDVSASFISQLENGKSQPSVATLYSICSALGVTVDELFAEASSPSELSRSVHPGTAVDAVRVRTVESASPITRADNPVIDVESRARLVLDTGVTWERLSAIRDQPTDFLLVRYEVGGSSTANEQLTRHAGTEYGFVLSGELEITLGFDTYVVRAGDAVSFNSGIPHRLRNSGDVTVEAIWFVHSA